MSPAQAFLLDFNLVTTILVCEHKRGAAMHVYARKLTAHLPERLRRAQAGEQIPSRDNVMRGVLAPAVEPHLIVASDSRHPHPNARLRPP